MLGNIDRMPLITIGMPIKNRAFCIRQVLSNIEELNYPKDRIKIVFVDDFSTDGTWEILTEWKDKVKGKYYKIDLIRAKSNIPQARNICIKNMEGDFILFYDSDVLVPPNALRTALDLIKEEYTLVAVPVHYVLIDPHNMKKWGEAFGYGFDFTLIRKKVFDLVGYFNELFYVGEEEILVRLREQTRYKIVNLPFPVLHLKPKLPASVRVKNYFNGLKQYFTQYSEIYLRSYSKLSLLYKIRILFFLMLPIVILSNLVIFFKLSNFIILSLILSIVYLILGVIPSIRELLKYGAGIPYIIRGYFIYSIPRGIAFSYGTLFKLIVHTLTRKNS
jgi:glycosyltransferase involved in cell wall biosynthesis